MPSELLHVFPALPFGTLHFPRRLHIVHTNFRPGAALLPHVLHQQRGDVDSRALLDMDVVRGSDIEILVISIEYGLVIVVRSRIALVPLVESGANSETRQAHVCWRFFLSSLRITLDLASAVGLIDGRLLVWLWDTDNVNGLFVPGIDCSFFQACRDVKCRL